jgi:hypothetical protein
VNDDRIIRPRSSDCDSATVLVAGASSASPMG